jgi:hypothetical protein
MKTIVSTLNVRPFWMVFISLFLIMNISFCQPPKPNPEEMAKKQTEWMTKNLNLTDDQVTKVSEINLKYAEKINEMVMQPDNDRESMDSNIKGIETSKDEELQPLLSEAQWKTYQDRKNEMRGPHP